MTADIEGMVLLAVDPGGATGPFHFQQDHLIISSLSLEGNGSGTAGCFKAVTSHQCSSSPKYSQFLPRLAKYLMGDCVKLSRDHLLAQMFSRRRSGWLYFHKYPRLLITCYMSNDSKSSEFNSFGKHYKGIKN